MPMTPFHAYYKARELEHYTDEALIPAFSASNIEIYPYQIAAASFALRSPYLKGCLLSDECSLGKTYEALLVATQKWHEGKTRQLLILPVNMVAQWIKKIESSFSLPYILMDTATAWNAAEGDNPFERDALVITTYDFAVQKAEYIQRQKWDLIVFDEADCLNAVYDSDKKNARILKQATDGSFKLLLTPTPIEMDIRDIYGLIYFIDETLLPASVDEFYQTYFRRPERYPELAAWISKFCFRTLKSQVTDYANFTNRVPYTVGCEMTAEEKALYDKVHACFMRPNSLAYPASNPHDLMLNHATKASSCAHAIIELFTGTLQRLHKMDVDGSRQGLLAEEISTVEEILTLAQQVSLTGKMKALLLMLKQAFAQMKRLKAPGKAIVFVNFITTLKSLKTLLIEQGYGVLTYNGENSRDYSVMERFRNDNDVQILIATDDMAKGLDIEFCPLVINYDMLTNATKLDQRISRCHRQGQKSDVLVVNLISRDNYADVRCLELINKRTLQFSGIFGMSDTILGNFDEALGEVLATMRPAAEIQAAFANNLTANETENRPVVEQAEEILFTTFTKEIADKVHVSPQYIAQKADEITADLWEVVKQFLAGSGYEIDETNQTATLPDGTDATGLFYYWTGSRNKPYNGLQAYGAAKTFTPAFGKITLTSPIGRGVLYNIECADEGTMTVAADVEPCTIGLFCVKVSANRQSPHTAIVFAGKTETGRALLDEECRAIMALPIIDYTEVGRKNAHWLKDVRRHEPSILDGLIDYDAFTEAYRQRQTPAQVEEIERMKLKAVRTKTALEHTLDDLRTQAKTLQRDAESATDRVKQMRAQKQLNALQRELREKEERLFYNCMRLDTELEDQIQVLQNQGGLQCSIERQFMLTITGNPS